MANKKQLKTLRKNRHKSAAGKRRRGKRKKSVIQKCRLRLSAQDTSLNEKFHRQQELNGLL